MNRRWRSLFICVLLLSALFLPARADIGPKPSVHVAFTGGAGETFYATLLSRRSSTGPASAWDGISEYSHWKHEEAGRPVWEAFVAYEDADGYYFLQEWWDSSETGTLDWTYYPPNPFKVLLYFPEQDAYCVSPIYERYAFDSYYTASITGWQSGTLTLEKDYPYGWELVSLAARCVLTIALELGLAFLFGFRERRVLRFLAEVNVVTQVGLNVGLNLINYHAGSMAFTGAFVLLEVAVCAAEGWLYARRIPRISGRLDEKGRLRRRAVCYAAAANVLSFGVGLWLARVIPGIF